MYSDEEYYENLGITEYDLDLAEEFERLFPPEPSDEDIELYMEALAEKYSDLTKIGDSLNYHNNRHQSYIRNIN